MRSVADCLLENDAAGRLRRLLTGAPAPGAEPADYFRAVQGKNPENRRRPSILALSRQNLPNLKGTSIEGVAKGAYIVHGGDEKPDAIIIATGALQCLPGSLTRAGLYGRLLQKCCMLSVAQRQLRSRLLKIAGSELAFAVEAAEKLAPKKVRVVSMPSWELFEEQSEEYKASVLPADVTARVSIEVRALAASAQQDTLCAAAAWALSPAMPS